MKIIFKLIFIVSVFGLFSSFAHVYGWTDDACEIKKNIEAQYGINLIMSDFNEKSTDYEKCLAAVDKSLSCFPKGMIKEITDSYQTRGIKTNIILKRAEYDLMQIPAKYEMSDTSADITINILSNNFYERFDVISVDGIMHELGHFIVDYLFDKYGYVKFQKELEKINSGYMYGIYNEDYNKVFVNQNSATNMKDDVSDLIWYAEIHPEKIREIGNGSKEIIHKKIEYLAGVFDKCFESINVDTKLWYDALPNSPDEWAKDRIKAMYEESLIPEELIGKYEAYISKEDFYILALNIIKKNIDQDEFYGFFNIPKPEKSMNIDPVSGNIVIDNDILSEYYNINLCNNKEKIYEAYKIGLIGDMHDSKFYPEDCVTSLEILEISVVMMRMFKIDTDNSIPLNLEDIKELNDLEKQYIYFAVENDIIKPDDNLAKPYEYCTYQDAYIMLYRVHELITNTKIE